MVSKPSSPGPNPAATPDVKQPRSRKAAASGQTEQGRAGSAGGVLLAKEQGEKSSTSNTKKAPATAATEDASAASGTKRRKPRKLNKEPTSTTTPIPGTTTAPTSSKAPVETPSATEIEALKARVRGLESKVEELYKSGAISDSRPVRSPRRRGKGRKGSSAAQVPTLATMSNNNNAKVQELDDDDEEEEAADEELVRLEGELEVARQDLESYRPRTRRTFSQDTEDVEEIHRDAPGTTPANDRQVTLSGSYRIPIPANVSVEDVKTIKSGVSAAQNVARSFLEQRRAASAVRAKQNPPSTQPTKPSSSRTTKPAKPKPTTSSSMEVAVDNSDGKQSWGEWIGGYSMAITRAVKNIEHEAAMESQRAGTPTGGEGGTKAARPSQAGRTPSAPGTKKAGGKRPPAKATLSGEQVHGLMS